MLRRVRIFYQAAVTWAIILSAATGLYGAQVNGADFEKEVYVSQKRLTLRGVGLLRYLAVIKAYAGAFYLEEGLPPASALENVTRRLELHYFHAIPAEDFATATTTMIEKNVTPEQFARLAPFVDRMNALYRDVAPGDRYTATYIPESGTELAFNGQALGTVPGADFSHAFFSIWIGANPIDKGFRNDLLKGLAP
ncbi:MAG: chalcone isomerase family protein [Thermodesulfobacteriota bacterium]